MTGQSDQQQKMAKLEEVHKATRAIIEAVGADLTLPEHRVLLALVHHLVTWTKLSDHVAMSVFVRLTGMREENIRRALNKLETRGVIERERGTFGGPRGARAGRFTLTPNRCTALSHTGSPHTGDSNTGEGERPTRVDEHAPHGLEPHPSRKSPGTDSRKGVAHDLARDLVTDQSCHGELPDLLAELNTTHSPDQVLDALHSLHVTDVRFRFPSGLRKALGHHLSHRATTPAAPAPLHPTIHASQRDDCDACHGDRQVLDDAGTAHPCRSCRPQAVAS